MRELARAGQHGAGRRARAGDRARVRPRHRDGARARARTAGSILFDGTPAALAKRKDLPTGRAWAASHAVARDRREAKGMARRSAARARTTCRSVDVAHPARRRLRGHRAERLGQVDARARRPLPRRRARPRRPRRSTGRGRTTALEGVGGARARGARRPVAARAHGARQPGDLREGVGPHPRALRRRAGGRRGAA